MKDVAELAGVSIKTVSRVVNHAPNVAPDFVEPVLAAITQLGFRPNDIARTLRNGNTTSTIGLVIEDLANPFYSTIASAVAKVARRHNSSLITESIEEDPSRERELILGLCQRRVDGLLIVSAGSDLAFLRNEIEMGTPAVFIDRPPLGLLADTVLIDNIGGAKAGFDRLLEAGHRRIGILLDSPSIYTMRERMAGVQASMAASGAVFDDGLVRNGIHEPAAAAQAVADMLETTSPPTAFFCGNNRITLGALAELWRRKSDADLAGFDDFETSDLMPRRLFVVGYDNRQLGQKAAELLFKRIKGDRSWPVKETIPTRIVERGVLSIPTQPSTGERPRR